jgi:hypothetical protein
LAFGMGERTGRRRRSWYRRRLRIQRSLTAFVVLAVLAAVGWQSVTRLRAYQLRRARAVADPSWTQGDVHSKLTTLAVARSKPAHMPDASAGVYPYSVIPGGVHDADELQLATRHDRLVWQHYANFQYQHARLVRATEARAVYLSYRLRNHIYWTRKKMRLHPGELLLTDGKITARTRCGNQISDEPKPEVSDEEPAEDVLDRPVAHSYPAPALPLRSSLMAPSLPGVDPLAPRGPQVFGGGFIFPYVPFGVPLQSVCESPSQEAFEQSHGINDNESDEKRCLPKRHKPPVVPEPSTILLISSGLAAIYWQYRRTRPARAL